MGRAKPIEISKFAHDAALDYLARPMAYDYTVEVRKQLIEVVEGYTGRCDAKAARAGIEWMREQARMRGEMPRF
jgi:hypothetical protein